MKYYACQLCKLSFHELWRMSNNPLEGAIAFLVKLLHIPIRSPGGFAPAENVE